MTAVQPTAMLTTQHLADAFANNARVLAMQTEGLTHADSLLQPSPRGNCLNWVLGHIAIYRGYILETLGEEKILSDEVTARYDYGSEPVLGDGEDILTLETLLDAIKQGDERLAAALARSTPESLEEMYQGRQPSTVAARVFYLYFHETYHVGQTEFLRQLAGTDDKVI